MLPRLANRSMAVKEWRGSILFLHRVVDGTADHSYGIHVARLAGVPDEVCSRAADILTNIERHELNVTGSPAMHSPAGGACDRLNQLDLFRSASNEIADRIGRLDLDSMTPMEALNLLSDLRNTIDGDV
jgi:DNA mismatch repair protein MutS